MPVIPKVHENYTPYLFNDTELEQIFAASDSIVQKDKKADPNLEIEFPVIIRLLYCCGLRIGETVKLTASERTALAAIFISFIRMVSTCCFRMFAGSTSRLNQLNKLYANMWIRIRLAFTTLE